MKQFFFHLGKYLSFLNRVFSRPEKWRIFFRIFFEEIYKLGIGSLGIVVIISIFMGTVITIQAAYNISNPFIPLYLVGLTTRDSMFLEFSSTVIGLILAGKVGSNIASEIGTMRVTEQIDAYEIMGINSASFLILPKTLAFVFSIPILVSISMFFGIFGGFLAAKFMSPISTTDFLYGLHYAFVPFYITYSLIKSLFFGFIIVTVSSYFGYYTDGGAIEVGRSSTRAVVYSSILILVFNLLLTQILLT
jgi:phospholipid/cholesterol/gamma-HCH transport system permease protein